MISTAWNTITEYVRYTGPRNFIVAFGSSCGSSFGCLRALPAAFSSAFLCRLANGYQELP